ncbi:hypothetical protein G6F68_017139 [Rhizopus microsporus]|nr:hypothetical protein G6F68_017139 [Rhizopus microsporus]
MQGKQDQRQQAEDHRAEADHHREVAPGGAAVAPGGQQDAPGAAAALGDAQQGRRNGGGQKLTHGDCSWEVGKRLG